MTARKYSRQREAILLNLQQRQDHPSADMIYEDMRPDHPTLSLGTVYRNLSLLTAIGEITRLPAINGADRYDARTDVHDHFICRRCGSVIDLPVSGHRPLLEDTQRTFDGRIESCGIRFYGVCRNCLESEGS